MASKDLSHINSVPNIVMWSWMRTVLRLCGSELLIFSYIFSQTFDSSHRCYACLVDMEDWFGVTRQTISRNIDRLVEKGFVFKECKQDLINPIIKHNSYMVNIPNVTELCENADKDSYQNFLDSYRSLLKQKFPEDGTKIDDYLNELMTWHENKNLEVCVKLNDLASLIYRTSEDNKPITDVLESVRKTNKKLKASPEKSYIDKSSADVLNPKQKKPLSDDGQTELFSAKPKRKSKKAVRAEWDADKRAMNTDFVYIRIGGNEKLLELLNKFLDTDNGQSYTPNQWEEQLETLYTYGRTPERMIEGVRISYMNNYRQLYIVDKSEVDMDKKLNAIDKYVEEFADNNDELRSLLCSYVTEVPKGKSFTESQFKLQLKTLTSLCKTTEDKIASVEIAYARSYQSLAYPSNSIGNGNSSIVVDEDKKIEKVRSFIKTGYYQLCDGLEDALITYVKETDAGRKMSYNAFCNILDNLRLYCLDDVDKVGKVKLAIQNNSSKFATEDYDETRRLRNKLVTRESKAQSLDRSRQQKVIMAKMKNPNDPRLVDVPKVKF